MRKTLIALATTAILALCATPASALDAGAAPGGTGGGTADGGFCWC